MRNYLQGILLLSMLCTSAAWATQMMECTRDPSYSYIQDGVEKQVYMEQVPELSQGERIKIEHADNEKNGVYFVPKDTVYLQITAKNSITNKNDILKVSFSDHRPQGNVFANLVTQKVDSIGFSPSNQLDNLNGSDNLSLRGGGHIPHFSRYAPYTWSMRTPNQHNKWDVKIIHTKAPIVDSEYNPDFADQLELRFSGRYTCKDWENCGGGICRMS